MKNLLNKSKNYKLQADKILKNSALIKLLFRYGEVHLKGSYKYDLMSKGDIDIHVIGEFDKEKATKVLDDLIEKTNFTHYTFFDGVKDHNPKFPKGYFITVSEKKDFGEMWKIDIWLVNDKKKENLEVDKLVAEKLNEKNKLIILKLKEIRDKKKLKIHGVDIYDAVLNHRVKNFKGLQVYLKKL